MVYPVLPGRRYSQRYSIKEPLQITHGRMFWLVMN